MAKLKLTLACGDYDFLRPLINGEIQPQGIELNVLTMPSPERHGRMLRHEEFDVCELSLVGYLVSRDKGCDYNAIPVFPHRRFRHQYMVKRTGCGIEKPADLNGKRVALDTLQNSAGLWMRGILQDHYSVDLKTIEWWCQVPQGKNVDQMLLDGEFEAALYPETLPSIRSGNPKVALLFPDPKKAEIEYYKKGGFFPIMHTVVVKNPILAKHPWVGMSLVRAFQQAKEICYARNSDPRSFALVWVQDLMREQQEIFGPDPWPYNLEDNRKALEAVIRYEFEQGMIKKKPKAEDLFFPPSLQRIQHYV
jgi:4,5-dihydroxyphthalate decarboxylase